VALGEYLTALKEAVRAVRGRFPDVSFYLFGSCSRGEPYPEDVDVLIIYPPSVDACALRREFSASLRKVPLHLFLVSENEEAVHRLVDLQAAVPVVVEVTN